MKQFSAFLLAGSLLAADPAPGTRLAFVTCPIVRDTKTVPCFLAEYNGDTYFLAIQQDIGAEQYPPQLLHEVLVEGTVATGPRVCGGIPLKPVSLSVMPEINRACSEILPAEDSIPAPDAPRPAGPSVRRTNLGTPPPPPEVPKPPFTAKEFEIHYDFDSDYTNLHTTRTINEVAAYARASGGRLEIRGYRGATLLSNGETLAESEAIAERRARKLAALFNGLGLSNIASTWESKATEPDGLTDVSSRRAVITVRP
jgi:hypothetical protein